jgi:plasmid maintenance system antidote protein VapI
MQSGKKVADELISDAKKAKQMAEELGMESNEIEFIIKEAENYSSTLDQLSKLIARNLGGL